MRILEEYSHLNGKEFLLVHRKSLWREIKQAIHVADAEACRTKVSRERGRSGEMLYSPVALNEAIGGAFRSAGWQQRRQPFWVTSDADVLREVAGLPEDQQKEIIEGMGLEAISSYNQTDFVKKRVAVEVQFGKYSFVAHDLFVKHMAFFISGVIDVGIEILPMKELEKNMSSGVPYYERDLLNLIRQGRSSPAVPLVLLGIAP